MTDIETLLEIEKIRTLKARYFRFVDAKDWAGLRALFTDDARFDPDSGMGEVEGPDAFVAGASAGLMECISVHHGHCPEIDLLSDTNARGIWPMEDMLRWRDGAASPIRTLHGYGHYHETYARIGGEWRIDSWKLTRLRVDTEGWGDPV
jgi:hypothetical protein